ncbi:MAG: amidohydrolase family protein [Proteobacteria bacterium]|nr:amidohydrolase family protein [Pseudomonadota bacterium]
MLSIVDANSSVYEPAAIWTDFLSQGERTLAEESFWYERGAGGSELVVVNGRAARPLNRSRLNRFACYRPGDTPESLGELDPGSDRGDNPGAWDGAARVRDLDALGIAEQIVYPTLFAEYFPVVDNPRAAVALARAYNDWARELAASGAGRLHPVAVIPLQSLPGALAEIERASGMGFRGALVRPSYLQGRYINHSDFDPVWAALAETGLVACLHPSPGSTNPEFTSAGPFVERVAANLGVGHDVAPAIAPVQDNMTAVLTLAYYGHLEDHPELKLCLSNAGASWLQLALEKAETYLWLFPPGPRPVHLEPAELFLRESNAVNFDAWEDPVGILSDVYGQVAVWGSRYPRHDAAPPAEAQAMLERHSVSAETTERLLGGNARRVFGL